MNSAQKALYQKRPKALDISKAFSLWVMTVQEAGDFPTAVIDTGNTPHLLSAKEAETAAKWLLRYAVWRAEFDRAGAVRKETRDAQS